MNIRSSPDVHKVHPVARMLQADPSISSSGSSGVVASEQSTDPRHFCQAQTVERARHRAYSGRTMVRLEQGQGREPDVRTFRHAGVFVEHPPVHSPLETPPEMRRPLFNGVEAILCASLIRAH